MTLPLSVLIPIVVRILMQLGVPSPDINDWTPEQRATLEKKVKDAIPRLTRWVPERVTDEACWQIVLVSWGAIVNAVGLSLIAQGADSLPNGDERVWPAMAQALALLDGKIAA